MEKKQSSVEWLGYELNTKLFYNISPELWDEVNKICEQAKAMHKEEVKMIIEHYHNSMFYLELTEIELENITEMIYKETFGDEKEVL